MSTHDNFFINEYPFASKKLPPVVNYVNKVIKKFGFNLYLGPDVHKDMSTKEQRINFYLLLDSVISSNIPGDIVELGSFTGQCALVFQKVIQQNNSERTLHLYDSFESKFYESGNIEEILRQNFLKAKLDLPVLHKGYFEETLPSQLPEQISFAHVDCGSGGDVVQHSNVVHYCLEQIYSRMPKGAICVIMDYHDSEIARNDGHDSNPGARYAVDNFLSDKPEEIRVLYGNQFSHGFFRKR